MQEKNYFPLYYLFCLYESKPEIYSNNRCIDTNIMKINCLCDNFIVIYEFHKKTDMCLIQNDEISYI